MTPNFVRLYRSDAGHSLTVPLKDLEPDELGALCDGFRAACFKKAGMDDPYRERVGGSGK